MRWRRCALCLCVLGVSAFPAQAQGEGNRAEDAAAALIQQRARAREQQAVLRERLAAVQQEIERQDAQRRDVTQALKDSERAISAHMHALNQLHQQTDAVRTKLARVREDMTRQNAALQEQRQTLAAQLRAQYVSGLSPWAALLAGDDPHAIGRQLGYLGYVAQAQTDAVRKVQQVLALLARLRGEAQAQQALLENLTGATQRQVSELQAAQTTQQQQLRQLDAQLRLRRSQADQLLTDVRGLEALVTRLEAEITRQAQAAQERPQDADRPISGEGFAALRGTLPAPVSGERYGRFGAQRPEGGLWRGVLIRAPQGAPVHAVARGRVVYADWLTGFGNLMIVDHGAQYLTVYAYNQSLLRAVGDAVDAGEPLALVGATGGQVEPGLYFEIRHQGTPVNPRLWLRQ